MLPNTQGPSLNTRDHSTQAISIFNWAENYFCKLEALSHFLAQIGVLSNHPAPPCQPFSPQWERSDVPSKESAQSSQLLAAQGVSDNQCPNLPPPCCV